MPIAIHPQNRVPAQVIDYIATAIRRDLLDGEDLHDITTSVDMGELDFIGAGEALHGRLVELTAEYDVSAAFLISEACIALGADFGSVAS